MPPALRKAAIVITALDTPAADALLAQMEPRQAQIVRSAVLSLSDVSPQEQQQVLEEFFRQQGRSERAASAAVTLELSASAEAPADRPPTAPSDRAGGAPPSSAPAEPIAATAKEQEEPPLAFLHEVDPSALAQVLRNEHPQTAAVVLAHLPPTQAAAVLQQLAPEAAIEALARMASLAPLAREVLLDLAQVLRRLVAPHRASAALEKLSAVLAAMDHVSREQVLAQLSGRHAALARMLQEATASSAARQALAGDAVPTDAAVTAFRYRLQRPTHAAEAQDSSPAGSPAAHEPSQHDALGEETWDPLEPLAAFDNPSLKGVLAQLDVPTLALALLGAEATLVARVLHLLPPDQAGWLRAELAQVRPARLRDIEQAQQRCRSAIRAAGLPGGQPHDRSALRARSLAASGNVA